MIRYIGTSIYCDISIIFIFTIISKDLQKMYLQQILLVTALYKRLG
jgi:hypothetical protein